MPSEYMANILPPADYKKVRNEYRARFLLVGSIIVFASASFVIAALVPSEIAVATYEVPSVASATTSNATISSDTAAIKHTQALLTILAPATTTPSLDPLSFALAARPAGVSIATISYSVTNHTISIDGHANTPAETDAYRAALQNVPAFTNVSVPVGALLGEQGGGFTITIKGHF